jgi:hypothetical protein
MSLIEYLKRDLPSPFPAAIGTTAAGVRSGLPDPVVL